MAAIDSITIKGFRSIASIEGLSLRPLNVLIGANGAGKSNLLAVLDMLREIREGRLSQYVVVKGGAETQLRFGSRQTSRIELSIKCDETTYSFSLVGTESDELVPEDEEIMDGRAGGSNSHLQKNGKEAGISGAAGNEMAPAELLRTLESCRLHHFADTGPNSPMKKTAQVDDNRFLRSDGSNLAAYLYLLSRRYAADFEVITRYIRQVCPFFDRFELQPQKLNEDTIRLEWRHAHSPVHMGATALSDGTLRFIALCCLLCQPEELLPSVILLDEPELGLHPMALTLIGSLIKRASRRTQLIVSTQSSALVDLFDPQDILVVERQNGSTVVNRIELPLLQEWLEEYSLGQLWEKNEIGGRPGRA